MNRKTLTSSALAIAVAMPAIINPVVSMADAQKQRPVLLAQTKTLADTPSNAKRALMAELSRLTAAQKREIGEGRIGPISQLSGNEILQAGCFTHGVGCQGTSGFTHGVICCVLKAGT
jgi:hypothetical protein